MKFSLVLFLGLATLALSLPVDQAPAGEVALGADISDHMGYLERVVKIYYKLVEIKYEIVCHKSVGEVLEMMGLPELVESVVQLAWMWRCENRKPWFIN